MKKLISLLCAMLLLALPALALADDAHLTVTGTATITLPADRAILSIGVRTTAGTATEAAAQNAEGITALLAALEAAGILPEDITTAEYNIYPSYDYVDGVSNLTGYQITNMLSVVIRDVTQIGAVLDGLAPGIPVEEDFIRHQLSLRRPYGKISTARVESDVFRIVSGVFE